MREIKFRGFSVLFNKWIYGVGLKYDRRGIPEIYSETGWYAVQKGSEGQYTGLKDKNGCEIYEGDIYHQGDPNITYTVVWHDTGLMGKQNHSSSYAGLSYWLDEIVVVGNIYGNPKLTI